MTALLLSGLGLFCVVFAVNSSIHSYLIVRYSEGDKVAADVGFYYMSNAAGRFVGTLASGAIYQFSATDKSVGLGYCFVASAGFSLIATLLTTRIDDSAAGLRLGRMVCIQPHADHDGGEGVVNKKHAAAAGEEGAATPVAAAGGAEEGGKKGAGGAAGEEAHAAQNGTAVAAVTAAAAAAGALPHSHERADEKGGASGDAAGAAEGGGATTPASLQQGVAEPEAPSSPRIARFDM